MNFEQFRADIAAFADDENDVIVQRDGQVIFPRSAQEISARLIEKDDSWFVHVDGQELPYRRFVSSYLARLDAFAERLLAKRTTAPAFVNGSALLESASAGQSSGKAMELLDSECRNPSPFAARIVFVTADAGHGKTVLLREYQAQQALNYLERKSPFIFWHVDLQGRQLLRLSEALMGDLGDLRISGLFMPGIVRLLHHRMLVLAIDGFDELAAEQGSTDALGALAVLVRQMQDRGTVVAASRRTFFDTEDYTRRTGLLRSNVSSQCEFDQIHLKPWSRTEAVHFLSNYRLDGNTFPRPIETYEETVHALGDDPQHPIVTRPFLLTHVARGLLLYEVSASEFISGMQNPLESVAAVVQAFVEREVSQKWKSKDTGEPYLTVDQHMRLLSSVAEEMWRSQVDRLDVDALQTIATMLLEHWGIAHERRRQVVEMVKMHVLLTPPADGEARFRSFDHPEFRNYFIAYTLAGLLAEAVQRKSGGQLSSFLSIGQLPDSVAMYACALIDRSTCKPESALELLSALVNSEWRPSFLQGNIGTLVPAILNGYRPMPRITFDGKVVYSSLVFEGSRLSNVELSNGTFIRASLIDANWDDVTIRNSDLVEVAFDRQAVYRNLTLHNCRIQGVRIVDDDDEVREYSPVRVAQVLARLGIRVLDAGQQIQIEFASAQEGEFRKLVRRVLRVFRRITAPTDHMFDIRFRAESPRIREQVLPLLDKHGIVKGERYHGGGPPQNRWLLRASIDDVLLADGGPGPDDFLEFWDEVGQIDASAS